MSITTTNHPALRPVPYLIAAAVRTISLPVALVTALAGLLFIPDRNDPTAALIAAVCLGLFGAAALIGGFEQKRRRDDGEGHD